jgi:DNA-3-methyladenine glycosylase II
MQEALDHLKLSDAVMATIIERVGPYRIDYREPTFEALARSIVFQQLSTKAARTIYNRLEQAAGGRITPEAIQKLSVSEMQRCGLSKQKTRYIRDLADHTASGQLDFNRLHSMNDDEVIAALTEIKGIGVWTAHMFLLFALRRPNVLAAGDLGVRTAVQRMYRKRKLPSPKQMEKLGKIWHPYCSVACWYLWRSLELPRDTTSNNKGNKGAQR